MTKDPAVLFYTQDFIVGTITMDYEQRGKYITLLCLQHQKGKLTDKDMKSILTEEDIEVAEKFIKSSDGYWYNIRLKEEAEKRKKYSESRRNNLMGKHKKLHMKSHLENENEDVNVNDNLKLKLVNKTITGNKIETKAERQDMLAEIITSSLDNEQKEIMNEFKNTFGI